MEKKNKPPSQITLVGVIFFLFGIIGLLILASLLLGPVISFGNPLIGFTYSFIFAYGILTLYCTLQKAFFCSFH